MIGIQPCISLYLDLYNSVMENRPKLYATTAFLAGILLTLGYKDFYPDLEWRFWRRRKANKTIAGAGFNANRHIDLEDHEKDGQALAKIPDGIEACIGNTPLFKLKSLSDESGCEILAKAEVSRRVILGSKGLSLKSLEFLNGVGGSPKDRVALSIINLVKSIIYFHLAESERCVG